ncbi:MAG TPA: flagellar protein FlaG [Fervidobacterium sp.]|nr:flagellar protein FlaG [Fervidobacterium sp.]HQE47888.1 flagellar protein FlaG [Fervidobacterium sp.]HUM42055.1 flagellar protein FlaG [Fervidobacterium sp.]
MEGVKGVNNVPNNITTIFPKNANHPAQTEGAIGKLDSNPQTVSQSRDEKDILNEQVDILKENLDKLRKIFRGQAEFRIDRDVNKVVIKIKDSDTGEIIRQIPPELVVKISKSIQELLGVLMDERV